jgi:hypothetical protein
MRIARSFLAVLFACALAVSAAPAWANVVNLRCTQDVSKGTLSVKIDYGTGRVTQIIDYLQPGKPYGGPGMAADGSVPAQITDALVSWAVLQNGEWYDKFQLDRYTGILREDVHVAQNQFPSYFAHCQVADPSQRKF